MTENLMVKVSQGYKSKYVLVYDTVVEVVIKVEKQSQLDISQKLIDIENQSQGSKTNNAVIKKGGNGMQNGKLKVEVKVEKI